MNPDEDKSNAPAPGAESEGVPPSNLDQTPTVGNSGGSKKTMWVWIGVILFVLLILFFGWWWWKDKDKKDSTSTSTSTDNSSQAQNETPECGEDLVSYTNEDLDIRFCYPIAWGDVSVNDARLQKVATTVDGATINPDTGQRWQLSFSEKPAVNLGLVTADWSTEVGRGGSCLDPATQTLPAFSPFSTEWVEDGSLVSRGIEVLADEYLIEETADEFYNGVCISGYTIINAEDFTHSTATYFKEFGGAVMTPAQHMASPNTLAPVADRDDFYAFVKSVQAL